MSFNSINLYLHILLLFLFASYNCQYLNCSWNILPNSPDVYYINMDKSTQRKIDIEKHLTEVGYKFFRVSGLTPSNLYIPDEIETTWRTAWCKTTTSQILPTYREVFESTNSSMKDISAIVSGLCGRGKNKNTPKELGCTTSHLVAIHKAVYSITTRSRYALIIEDDVSFPFNINFDELVKSAPNDFVILQLFNSNKDSMKETWNNYLKNPNFLFVENKNNLKFWSTCAYLIDRIRMKPLLDAVYYHDSNDGWFHFSIIAGIQGPCAPKECCIDNKFQQKPPCVWASNGYQADSYLYALAKTYVTTIPMITNGQGVSVSTFHQNHVEMFHKASFIRQRQYINDMLRGKVNYPSYLQPACTSIPEIQE